MKHCIVMVCKLFGNSNLSRHVELVLAGYKSTGVSWLHAWTFFYVSIWMSWNIQITWTIYLLLIKCQSGFIGGKSPTFHLGFIQNFNLFFHQSAQFRKHTITKHIIIFVLSSWHYSQTITIRWTSLTMHVLRVFCGGMPPLWFLL